MPTVRLRGPALSRAILPSVLALLVFLVATQALAASVDPTPVPGERTEVMVPMRDGVRLATDVYLPQGEGPWPVVLRRTPYDKGTGGGEGPYTAAGYALVLQDQRGRFRSEGEYTPHENEMRDGYDTVEWIAAQPWSDGKVGISGASALGIAANMAAAADPPHLVAAYVVVAPASLFFEGRFIGGLFKKADTGNWMRRQGVSEESIAAYKRRVVLDERWQQMDFTFRRHAVDIPIYNVGGWYDLFLQGNVTNFRYLQEWGRPGARGNQKLLIGPFGHGRLRGDLEYPDAERPGSEEELRWFDHWLKGEANGIMDEPAVRWYQRAAAYRGEPSEKNVWRQSDTWPPNGTTTRRLYLREGLALSFDPPDGEGGTTTYRHDPAEPVPTVGGLNLTLPLGPMDQRAIEERPDYLRFETEPLQEDLTLAGALTMELWAATDVPDTDFMVKVVDVYPNGYEALVLDTGIRTRFRHGRRAQDVAMMTPGQAEKLQIDLWQTGIVLEKGHRLAVHISSSNDPRFDVNLGDGAEPGRSTGSGRVATNTVFHDRLRPSALLLPVLED